MKKNRTTLDSTGGRFPAISALLILLCALLIAALAYKPFRDQLGRIEYWTSDWRMVFLSDRAQRLHPKIAIVTFNNETFGGQPRTPIPRDFHADVIDAIDKMKPRVIGLDFYFLVSQSPAADEKFFTTLKNANTKIVVGTVDESASLFKPHQFKYQKDFLAQTGQTPGYINLLFGTGNVVRFTQPPLQGSEYKKSFAYQLATLGGAQPSDIAADSASIRIAWLIGPNFNVRPFVTIPAHKILMARDNNSTDEIAKAIEGKIVLTGIDFPYMDQHETPLTVWTGHPMRGVMIHAQAIAQLLDGRLIYELSKTTRALFLLVVSIVGLLLSWMFWRRSMDITGIGVATVTLVALDAISFAVLRTALPLVFALYVWFTAVTFGHHAKSLLWWWRRGISGSSKQSSA